MHHLTYGEYQNLCNQQLTCSVLQTSALNKILQQENPSLVFLIIQEDFAKLILMSQSVECSSKLITNILILIIVTILINIGFVIHKQVKSNHKS